MIIKFSISIVGALKYHLNIFLICNIFLQASADMYTGNIYYAHICINRYLLGTHALTCVNT